MRLSSLLLLLVFILSACTTTSKDTPSDEYTGNAPELLFQNGDYALAAQQFTTLANEASGPQAKYYQLRAIAALARTNQTHLAAQQLEQILIDENDILGDALHQLAQAHIAIAERQTDLVLEILTNSMHDSIPAVYHIDYYNIRAEVFIMLDNKLALTQELVNKEKYLTDEKQIKENQKIIWSALASMNERSLVQLRSNPPPDVLSGWMELVYISKVYQLSPVRLKEQILVWKQRYPQHPASDEILTALLQRKQEDVAYPDRIALLLPLSGRYEKAGKALRDGILAAYYTHRPNQQQSITVYDIGSTEDVTVVYQQAVDDGAQFIIGPLRKEAVVQIAAMDDLPVPVLALNYLSEDDDTTANLFQFGLSPEEEAKQVAERTWLDGHVYAAVLVPTGPWGERIRDSFNKRWHAMGGQTVEFQVYDPSKNDFAQPIKMLLNIDDSKRRYRRVATTVKRKVKFTPRRRQDVDFIFVAAYPRQARQIRPQLKFFHASNLPVYSTSHVFTGTLNQERDRDMDGVVFGDMPWVLSESTSHRGMRPTLEKQITEAGNQLQRLYALGLDSFNIIGALNTLEAYPYERFDGETGSLMLDNQRRIHRQLTWVRFRSGRPIIFTQDNL